MPHTDSLFCAYCGNEFHPADPRERFCSERCLKLFGTKHNIAFPQSFELSDELGKLQKMIERTPFPNGESISKETLILFYDSVFLQLTRILKWINSQALIKEKQAHTEKGSVDELQKKLALVLSKVAHLKQENKELRDRVYALQHSPNDFAFQLLGVTKQATKDEIKRAFRDKAKLVHPDSGFSDESFFKALKLAYTYASADQP
jgi:hypothetical protein